MAEIEPRLTTLEQQVNNVITKLDMFIEESREARKKFDDDMRAAREKHDADMREMRSDIRAAREKHDADMLAAREKHDADMREMRSEMRELKTEIGNLGNSFRTMNVTVIIGIAAMVVAILLK